MTRDDPPPRADVDRVLKLVDAVLHYRKTLGITRPFRWRGPYWFFEHEATLERYLRILVNTAMRRLSKQEVSPAAWTVLQPPQPIQRDLFA